MKVTEAVNKRRSVKWFDPAHRMPEEVFRQMMQLALLSPTAFNIQNWRFVRVTDRAQRKAIRAAAWDQAQVEDASELLVLCFDCKAWEHSPERFWRLAPQEVQDILVPAIARYYDGKPQIERDEGMRSCGLVGQNLMLVAQELGYDSCPMDGFDYDKVGEIIALPKDHGIAFMLAIGKGIKAPWPRPGQLALEDVLVENRFAD
jgi:nitroreductase